MNTPESQTPKVPTNAAAKNATGTAADNAEFEERNGSQAEKQSDKGKFKFLDRLGLGFLMGAILLASTKFWARLPSRKKSKRRD